MDLLSRLVALAAPFVPVGVTNRDKRSSFVPVARPGTNGHPLLSRTGVLGWEIGITGVSQPGQINVFVVVYFLLPMIYVLLWIFLSTVATHGHNPIGRLQIYRLVCWLRGNTNLLQTLCAVCRARWRGSPSCTWWQLCQQEVAKLSIRGWRGFSRTARSFAAETRRRGLTAISNAFDWKQFRSLDPCYLFGNKSISILNWQGPLLFLVNAYLDPDTQ